MGQVVRKALMEKTGQERMVCPEFYDAHRGLAQYVATVSSSITVFYCLDSRSRTG
jgi:hypothetical protein